MFAIRYDGPADGRSFGRTGPKAVPGREWKTMPHLPHTGPDGNRLSLLLREGFRPFFPAAALYGIVVIAVGMAERAGLLLHASQVWHAHEMLFGFGLAVLAGFLLTAVANWTGSPPLGGKPLFLLFAPWLAGRLAFLCLDRIGLPLAAAIDCLFLPCLLLAVSLPVVQARKWRDLKVLVPLGVLMLAHAAFYISLFRQTESAAALRAALSVYVFLITIVGGRLLPSEIRVALRARGRADLPPPHGLFDTLAIFCGGTALVVWSLAPESGVVATCMTIAAVFHGLRLIRWRGWTLWRLPLLAMLFLSYAFLPLGFAITALASAGVAPPAAALHVLAIGAMGCMMFAVMLRMSLRQTGKPLNPEPWMIVAWSAIALAVPIRFIADTTGGRDGLLFTAGLLWIAAFGMFLTAFRTIVRRPVC